MKYGNLVVEKREYERVKKLLTIDNNQKDVDQKLAIRKLMNEVKFAQSKPLAERPEDVVRLNSTVMFTMPDMSRKRFKIVMPKDSDIAQKRLSLLSPMGLALFGYAKGDSIEWQFPSGNRVIAIVDVEQETTES